MITAHVTRYLYKLLLLNINSTYILLAWHCLLFWYLLFHECHWFTLRSECQIKKMSNNELAAMRNFFSCKVHRLLPSVTEFSMFTGLCLLILKMLWWTWCQPVMPKWERLRKHLLIMKVLYIRVCTDQSQILTSAFGPKGWLEAKATNWNFW